MTKEYYIDRAFLKKRKLIVSIDEELIDLKGKDSEEKLPDTAEGPGEIVKIRGADQEDLAKILNNPEKYGNFSKIIKFRDLEKTAKIVKK